MLLEALRTRRIASGFSHTEVENLLYTNYSTKYSYLILSLLYQNRDWKDHKFHEDHIFPKSEFTAAKLKARGYNKDQIGKWQEKYNTIINLQLLSDTENLEKGAESFDTWISTRDDNFKRGIPFHKCTPIPSTTSLILQPGAKSLSALSWKKAF